MRRRRWLLWLLLIALVWFLASRFVQIEQFVATLTQGEWRWVLAAALLQVVHYWLYALLFQLGFAVVGVTSRVIELLPVTFASLFVGVLAITGGAPLFVDDAARRGQSSARASAGALLVLVADFDTFALILLAGLAYLAVRGVLYAYEIAGTVALVAFTVGLAAVLFLGLWRPALLHRLLHRLQRTVNALARRFLRTAPLREDWADTYTAEFTEAANDIALHPRETLIIHGVALAFHLVDVLTLYLIFLAFHQPALAGTIVAAYGIGLLFYMISITPQGIGVVEGVMVLVLDSLGIPGSAAAVITLAFRGVTFWLPLVAGVILWPRVRSFGG